LSQAIPARAEQVQAMCGSGRGYVIFVEPAAPGGARATTGSASAREYSSDRIVWSPLPEGLGPVTGQLDGHAAALVFDRLTTDVVRTIDLWTYADGSNADVPLRFLLGLSTACAVRKDMSRHPGRMKSRYRRVAAVAQLAEPYCVWLRWVTNKRVERTPRVLS
jgi:hypothetical protein